METDDLLLNTLVEFVDALSTPFDIIELMDELVRSCMELMPADSAGILLDDLQGGLRVLASSTQSIRHLELLELQHREGPCFEAVSMGRTARVTDLRKALPRWPTFASAAIERGITAAYAVPMTLREHRLGALNLFCVAGHELDERHLRIAHVLATMATNAVFNHRSIPEQELLAQQLQTALTSRVLIEQAKGVLAEREGVGVEEAFDLLRRTARSHRRQLSDVAADIVAGGSVDSGGVRGTA